MSAKHGIAGAVFLVLIAGPAVQAQIPTDLPYLKPSSPANIPVNPTVSGPSSLPAPLDTTPSAPGNPLDPVPRFYVGGQAITPVPLSPEDQLPPGAIMGNPIGCPNGASGCGPNGASCCGPVGAHGPIGTEFFARTGPSFIAGGGTLASVLRTGWDVEGGGRSLFYSTDGLSAWLIEASLNYIENGGNLNGPTFQGNYGPGDLTTIHWLNRTAVHAGLGKDWWYCGPGDVGSNYNPNFRFGVFGGGTWGTSHVDLNSPIPFGNYERIQKIYGGGYAGIHFDVEVPMGAWTFVTGVRGEWTYDCLHVLPGNNNIQGVNLLWNVGLRY